MEQMVLEAGEQPCHCWRGNWPWGGCRFTPPALRILSMFFELCELTRTFRLLITSLGSLGSRPP